MKLEVQQASQKLYELVIPDVDLVNGAEVFIGRAEDCHVVLEDQQVSRRHAMLSLDEGRLKLQKLSEMGSLSVNGNEVSSFTLGEGDKFSIIDFNVLVSGLPETLEQEHQATPLQEDAPSIEDELSDGPPGPDPDFQVEATELLDSLEQSPEEDEEESGDGESELEREFEGAQGGFTPDEEDMALGEEASSFDEDAPEEEGFSDDVFGGGDDGFGDDGFGSDEDSGFGAGEDSTQLFQSFAKYFLEIDGEMAPFDKFEIDEKEVYIGRDPEKCQIVLNDPEVSSVHAVIRKTLINCFVEDLDSSNGTVFNGSRVNKAELTNNDNFQIGSTIFTVKIVSDLIESEKDTLMPVEDGQEVEVEEVVEEEVDYDGLALEGDGFELEQAQEKSVIKRIWNDPKKRKIAMVLLLVTLVLWLMEEESGTKTQVQAPKKAKVEKDKTAARKEGPKKNLAPEVLASLEENYALALAKYEAGEYYEAKQYLDKIRAVDPNYKDTQTLTNLVRQGHEELLRLKAEEEAEKERKKRQLKIKGMLAKAKEAVEKREVAVAESIFGQILEIDPENMDVPQLKLELDAYKEEQRRIKEEAARKKALRQAMVDALAPGKTFFLKSEWYKAIDRLEKFTKKKGMDEDLMAEATDMLRKARKGLAEKVDPLLGRARSFNEGQDLKRAYETYGEVLKYDPTNEEAITQRDKIHESLRVRSMKLYREALISESLSLFDEAKEKFEEVQQVSPINSEYYNKATERLKNYLE